MDPSQPSVRRGDWARAMRAAVAVCVLLVGLCVGTRHRSLERPAPERATVVERDGVGATPHDVVQRAVEPPPAALPPSEEALPQPYLWERFPLPFDEPGHGTVTCEIDAAARGRTGAAWGTVEVDGKTALAMYVGGSVVASVPAGAGSATFRFDSVGGTFSWAGLAEAGAAWCATSEATWRTGVHGTVEGAPVPRAYVVGCGAQRYGEVEDNAFFMEVDAPAECELRVRVDEDDRVAYGPAVAVRTKVGEDLVVTLRYPEEGDYRFFTAEELRVRAEVDRFLQEFRERREAGRGVEGE